MASFNWGHLLLVVANLITLILWKWKQKSKGSFRKVDRYNSLKKAIEERYATVKVNTI